VGISFLKVKRRDDAEEEVDNTVVKGGGHDIYIHTDEKKARIESTHHPE
jgi:hypothetical protein